MKKKLVVGLLLLFLGFWLVQAPNSLATTLEDGGSWAWQVTTRVFTSVIDFLGALGD